MNLYQWAGEIIRHLQQGNGTVPPKLALGEALGITSDPRWRGANRTSPVEARHRVVARFAREDRFESLWSLNWDCLIENALERVGLSRDTPRPDLPWKTHYRTFVTVADAAAVAGQQTLPFFKPHGCVRALDAARAALDANDMPKAHQYADRFLITEDELRIPALGPDGTQQHLFAHLETRLAQMPLITLGWRAAEPYLCELVEQRVAPALRVHSLATDELCIVDLTFNNNGHQRLAAAYGQTPRQAHVEVEASGFTLDALWLWVQALYGVQHLRACHPVPTALDAALAALQTPVTGRWIIP